MKKIMILLTVFITTASFFGVSFAEGNNANRKYINTANAEKKSRCL
ncbi:hypothetical protein [Gottschalkia acidurici]|nr:hypothetical protein [Gottschalkia acidurici]